MGDIYAALSFRCSDHRSFLPSTEESSFPIQFWRCTLGTNTTFSRSRFIFLKSPTSAFQHLQISSLSSYLKDSTPSSSALTQTNHPASVSTKHRHSNSKMAPTTTQLLTLALLAVSATAADGGYGPPPPPIPPPPYAGPDPIYNPHAGSPVGFPPGFPFNNLPPLPGSNPNPNPVPGYSLVIPAPPKLTSSTAGGIFTTVPGSPGGPRGPGGPTGPVDPNCPKTIVSTTVVTHISTTVVSFTNTISSLQTLTNSVCVPVIPTLPPAVSTSETAGGVFTTTSTLPGGSLTTITALTTLSTSKVTVPGLPSITLPTIPGGGGSTGPGTNPTSKSFSYIPPPIQTYPPSPPIYPPLPSPIYGGGSGGYGDLDGDY
ncbi:hypothetical protein BKA64DRAFT_68828 [Cadophora sp. MPI-SDFR-AT-0126]|nr:hypothetical protein BKA64DRAFT_68828 [Leotiomycetes sp. MPI-SDFR-AT-0126]